MEQTLVNKTFNTLFDYLHDYHDLILVESEMRDLAYIIKQAIENSNEFKQLIIADVSHQRELLNFLAKEWNPNQCTMDSTIEYWYIEEIIEKFNCG